MAGRMASMWNSDYWECYDQDYEEAILILQEVDDD